MYLIFHMSMRQARADLSRAQAAGGRGGGLQRAESATLAGQTAGSEGESEEVAELRRKAAEGAEGARALAEVREQLAAAAAARDALQRQLEEARARAAPSKRSEGDKMDQRERLELQASRLCCSSVLLMGLLL